MQHTKQSLVNQHLNTALWRIYKRPDRPEPWQGDGNLPWNEPEFSARMLREHLDESHSAASRTSKERQSQIPWLWDHLNLSAQSRLCDVTCGPGLYAVEFAKLGCHVTGIDFSPASMAHARTLATAHQVADRCHLIEEDVRRVTLPSNEFDAALFLYGQLAVFHKTEAQQLLTKIAGALKPGGRLCVELLNQAHVDKNESKWWFTDQTGLWGDRPFLHLGERMWDAAAEMSIERFYTLHLESGAFQEIQLCDQTYAVETMQQMMHQAGFAQVDCYLAWDGLPINDAQEWVVYVASKSMTR